MINIYIQKVLPHELQQLQKIAIQTFKETFTSQNSEKDMLAYLKEKFDLSNLTAEFHHPDSEFFFALMDSKIAGYLKINKDSAQTEHLLQDALEIERIYVLNEYQAKKIGKMLLEKALEMGEIWNKKWIWLGVWEQNSKAIAFYKKYGFEIFEQHPFILGTDVQTDLMMRLKLK